jgi:hypothetical protein
VAGAHFRIGSELKALTGAGTRANPPRSRQSSRARSRHVRASSTSSRASGATSLGDRTPSAIPLCGAFICRCRCLSSLMCSHAPAFGCRAKNWRHTSRCSPTPDKHQEYLAEMLPLLRVDPAVPAEHEVAGPLRPHGCKAPVCRFHCADGSAGGEGGFGSRASNLVTWLFGMSQPRRLSAENEAFRFRCLTDRAGTSGLAPGGQEDECLAGDRQGRRSEPWAATSSSTPTMIQTMCWWTSPTI